MNYFSKTKTPDNNYFFVTFSHSGAAFMDTSYNTSQMNNTGEQKKILVAGAGGHTGKHIVPLLLERGYAVRLLTRRAQRLKSQYPDADIVEADITSPSSLRGICADVHAVISTVGASLDMNNMRDRRSFHDVDFIGNSNLLKEAQQLRSVTKFVYLSAFGAETTNTAYTNEHEAFVALLQKSDIDYAVVRPTGFFYVNGEFLKMAQRGFGMVIGDGSARTNPIHEADVAQVCVDALVSNEQNINIGGAETFTRKEIVELAFRVLGKKPSIRHIPASMMRVSGAMARLMNRRVGEILEFGVVVATHDCVAPALPSKHRLEDYFRAMISMNGKL